MPVAIKNLTRAKINLKLLEKISLRLLAARGKSRAEVSIAFVSAGEMSRLNRIYRGRKGTTDVLSFTGGNEDGFLGEIVIDYGQIKKQAKIFNQTAERELVFILIHGFLHLFGYEDGTAAGAQKMEKIGEKIASKLYDKNKQIS